jgi:Fur family ferric uptake transcriptional regulator
MQRQTQQRAAIRRAFDEADRPLSPQEVLQRATGSIPSLGIATVYRNIRTLVAENWLRSVELPGTPDRYEVAGKGHHHHFHCRCCDGVFEVDACPGPMTDLSPNGFILEAHEIILYGLCRGCNSNP